MTYICSLFNKYKYYYKQHHSILNVYSTKNGRLSDKHKCDNLKTWHNIIITYMFFCLTNINIFINDITVCLMSILLPKVSFLTSMPNLISHNFNVTNKTV